MWPAGFFPLQDSMSCGCHVCCLVVVVVVVTYTVSIFIYCPLFHKSQPFNTSTAGPNVDYQWFDRFMVTDKVGLFLFFWGGGEGGMGTDQNLAGHWMGLHPNILFNL